MASLLIKNGRVIDPANGIDKALDVLVQDGVIAQVGPIDETGDTKVIDAAGKLVVPGLIDPHVHLREPGDEEEETIASGAQAAVAGGFTSIACMPNTEPPIDNEATVDFVHRRAATAKLANVYATGAITRGREGKELAEMGQMVRGGAVAFTDDGCGVQDPAVMLRAFQYASMFDKVIMQHCQDEAISGDGCMNSGSVATVLGLPGSSPLAEELMIARDLLLLEQTQARYHVQHVSTAKAAAMIRQAKQQGLKVTAEVTPHHLLLTHDHCQGYDTNYKVNPPLRTSEDVTALREAVADGTIDCLVTDHAPHLSSEKELEFPNAPPGMVGLDCAVGLYAKALVETNTTGWPRIIEMMTITPAKILRIKKGTLGIGADADITIIDPKLQWQVDVEKFHSKSRNCPYHGWDLTGRPVTTIVAGEIRFQLEG